MYYLSYRQPQLKEIIFLYKFIMSLTSIFNETKFQEILFPSSGNVNDFDVNDYEHLERKK